MILDRGFLFSGINSLDGKGEVAGACGLHGHPVSVHNHKFQGSRSGVNAACGLPDFHAYTSLLKHAVAGGFHVQAFNFHASNSQFRQAAGVGINDGSSFCPNSLPKELQ